MRIVLFDDIMKLLYQIVSIKMNNMLFYYLGVPWVKTIKVFVVNEKLYHKKSY